MQDLKLKQLEYEADTWKRLLSFMMDENIHLKNRLSEFLRHTFAKNYLEEIENFQSRFLKQDELICLLRNDLAEVEKLLVREILVEGKILDEINRKLNKLRNHVCNTELQFNKLKCEFSNYLSDILNNRDREKFLSDN